jgi:uncharacterized protein YjiS (DUF1127 family)
MSMMQIAQRLHWQGLHWRQRSRRDLIALIKQWWRRMDDRRTLATMDDQSLRDIGVTRYEAWYEARKPFWRA